MWFVFLYSHLEERVYCFSSVCSVRNQYFPSHFSQQPCMAATSNLVLCFGLGAYRSLTEFRSAKYQLSVFQFDSFLDSASWDRGVYSVSKNSQIFLFNHFGPWEKDPVPMFNPLQNSLQVLMFLK